MSRDKENLVELSPVKRQLLSLLMKKGGIGAEPAGQIPRRAESGACPLSFAQQRLWFFDQLEPGNPLYNVGIALRLTGRLDAPALERSLNEVVRRHENLRTTFRLEGGQPVQVVEAARPLSLAPVELRHLPPQEREAEAARLIREEAARPFDLTRGPLLRTTLIRLGEEEHVLLLTLHHIISDGWSLSVLVREVAALYEAALKGRPAALPALPIQYADFALWQRDWMRGEVLEAQVRYWRERLGENLSPLELPADRARPAGRTYRGAAYRFSLDEELTDALNRLSRREGATLFMTLMASFQALLYAYTGQEDVRVGTPVANRRRREIEGLIGFFVNTLVIRTDLGGDPDFRTLLGRVKEAALGAYAHQDVPFERLVEELGVERDLDMQPLFRVALALQNIWTAELALHGLKLEVLDADTDTTKFDLILLITEEAGRLNTVVEYSTDLFEAATIERMMSHWRAILERAVADPGLPLSSLSALPADQSERVVWEWNDTRMDFPREMCVHHFFEAQAARTPDAAALVFGDEQLSYGELNRRANRLANYLRKAGVGPEVLVGVCLERSVEMVVAVLAAVKAGGAYVPLDPQYPGGRVAYMLEDARVHVLLTRQRIAERLPRGGWEVVCLDTSEEMVGWEEPGNPQSGVTPDNLVYVLYTSGSTGQPKGTMMPHRSMINHLTFLRRGPYAQDSPRTLQFASLSFDVSFQEIFSSLGLGGTLVLIEEEARRDARELLRTIIDQRVERFFLTFSSLQLLAEAVESGLGEPRSLREVFPGGEQLRITPQITRMFDRLAGCVVENHYGPTETHMATTWRLPPSTAEWPTIPPVGRPIGNTRIYILNQGLRPVPVGATGELYIGGACVARGYLRRPGLTAARFLPDPYSPEPGSHMYRTGDVARYLADGRIEYVGRSDNQVKVRGFRIEPGEVEAALEEHPAVLKTVVVARPDARGHNRLIAYVVARPEGDSGAAEFRQFLRGKLPDHMVPSAFLLLDELPLTPSGKVDRRSLPTPDLGRPEMETSYVAPRTLAEEVVAAIWRDVLGVEEVGVYDNFFDLGGHSLLATRVIARVREAFHIEQLPLRRLFETPTVAGLVEALTQFWGGADVLERVALTLKQVEQLSADEIEARLADRGAPVST